MLKQRVQILKLQIDMEGVAIRRRNQRQIEGGSYTVLKKCLQFFFLHFHDKNDILAYGVFSISHANPYYGELCFPPAFTLLWRRVELNLREKVRILKSQIGGEISGIRRRYLH